MSNKRRARPGRRRVSGEDPGLYTVRGPVGAYLVRYAHSAPFTVIGRLGETHGGSIGRNPVIAKTDGTVMLLDPRAIITLNGERVYGPRDLAADDHTADMRAWLIEHPEWDT